MSHSIESTHLGKATKYSESYDAGLLVAVPRKWNREQYGIHSSRLPFSGKDVWHAWEVGFLLDNGLPFVGVLKLVYDCSSEFLVESKSLKLYLNSFNMTSLGSTRETAITEFTYRVKRDLSTVLQTDVAVSFFSETAFAGGEFEGYLLLESEEGILDTPFSFTHESPELLAFDAVHDLPSQSERILKAATHLLRSNCKITHQPDWGSVFIDMHGYRLPTKTSLLQYIVSFRRENHFHEEVCEMIFKRLQDIYNPISLAVTCVYTRRGGIDICPSRVSDERLLPHALCASDVLCEKLLRQ